jgi:hypothetical protein
MSQSGEEIQSGCGPLQDDGLGGVCQVCQPKLALSREEESILGKMREIKDKVRPITARINELQAYETSAFAARITDDEKAEWCELVGVLTDLREQWKRWETKLELAIEDKLVALGHRDPM